MSAYYHQNHKIIHRSSSVIQISSPGPSSSISYFETIKQQNKLIPRNYANKLWKEFEDTPCTSTGPMQKVRAPVLKFSEGSHLCKDAMNWHGLLNHAQ